MQTKCVESLVKNDTNVGAARRTEVDKLSPSIDDPSYIGKTFGPTHCSEYQVCTHEFFAHLSELSKLIKDKEMIT